MMKTLKEMLAIIPDSTELFSVQNDISKINQGK